MNKVQKLVAELMKLSSFNAFDGDDVVNALEANSDLWEGFVWGRFDGHGELITLRDISSGIYNADTLYVLAKEGREDELAELFNTLNADEIGWESETQASSKLGSYGGQRSKAKTVLRVWWD